MKNEKDYYEILEISSNASDEVIKMAYKALVKKYHPDVRGNKTKEEYDKKMKEINEAYEILSNPQKRAQYDWERKTTYSSASYSENINYESKQNSIEINNLKTEKEEVKTNKVKKIYFIIFALLIIVVIISLIMFLLNCEFGISKEDELNKMQNLVNNFEETEYKEPEIQTGLEEETQPEIKQEIIQKPISNNKAEHKQPEVTEQPTNKEEAEHKQSEVTEQPTNNQGTQNKQPEKKYCPGEQKCPGAPSCPGGKQKDCPGAVIKTCTSGHACPHGFYNSHQYNNGTEVVTCNEVKKCIHGQFEAHDYKENCKHGYSFAHQYIEYCEHGWSTDHRIGTCEHAFTYDHMEPCEHGSYDPHYY